LNSILILNGPNLNLLGLREPGIYGKLTLESIEKMMTAEALRMNVALLFKQSNHEGVIIDAIHEARSLCSGIIINPGAFTHTSVAIRDAIAAVNLPTIEVHLSNVYKRESFRHHSHIAPVAVGQISGFGADSYRLGLYALVRYLENAKELSS
jgi:3-dehydroquinate dehydratase-2